MKLKYHTRKHSRPPIQSYSYVESNTCVNGICQKKAFENGKPIIFHSTPIPPYHQMKTRLMQLNPLFDLQGKPVKSKVKTKSIKSMRSRIKPIKRKSIKRKSIKRKSIKRKSIKRKSIKRKSIKRKSIKRKSIKRKVKTNPVKSKRSRKHRAQSFDVLRDKMHQASKRKQK